jgi:hypothetical protein
MMHLRSGGDAFTRGRGIVHERVQAPRAARERAGCIFDQSVYMCVCLLLQYLIQSCWRGGRRIVEDMCYEIRRAEACVD